MQTRLSKLNFLVQNFSKKTYQFSIKIKIYAMKYYVS